MPEPDKYGTLSIAEPNEDACAICIYAELSIKSTICTSCSLLNKGNEYYSAKPISDE